MNCNPPDSFVHGISQSKILDWVAISFSRESSWPRDQTCISCLAGGFFTTSASWEAHDNILGSSEKYQFLTPPGPTDSALPKIISQDPDCEKTSQEILRKWARLLHNSSCSGAWKPLIYPINVSGFQNLSEREIQWGEAICSQRAHFPFCLHLLNVLSEIDFSASLNALWFLCLTLVPITSALKVEWPVSTTSFWVEP